MAACEKRVWERMYVISFPIMHRISNDLWLTMLHIQCHLKPVWFEMFVHTDV